MGYIAIRKHESFIRYMSPLFLAAMLPIVASEYWSQLSRGIIPDQFINLVQFVIACAGIGHLCVMFLFKNLYYRRSDGHICFTRPFLGLGRTQISIGKPRDVAVLADMDRDNFGIRQYWIEIRGELDGAPTRLELLIGEKTEAVRLANRISGLTGAPVFVDDENAPLRFARV